MRAKRLVIALILAAWLVSGCGGDERRQMIREAKRNTPVEQVR